MQKSIARVLKGENPGIVAEAITGHGIDRGTEFMTINIQLKAEIIERLAMEAEARGIALEQYASSLLEEALARLPEFQRAFSIEELRAMLTALAEGSENLPTMRTSTFTRESFYEGRI